MNPVRAFIYFWLTIIVIAAGALAPVGCASLREDVKEIRELPVDTTAPAAVQETHRALRVAHAELAKLAGVIGSHKGAGLMLPDRANALLDDLDKRQKELVRVRENLSLANAAEGLNKAKLQEEFVKRLTREVAQEVAARAAAKGGGK